MHTDELRAELAELAREVDEFPEKLPAIRRRVARRRLAQASVSAVLVVGLIVGTLVTTDSSDHAQIGGTTNEVKTADLERLDALVVLPATATDAEAEQARAILDSTGAVEEYASFPPAIVARLVQTLSGPFVDAPALRVRVCDGSALRTYGVGLSRQVPDALDHLVAAMGSTATVHSVGKPNVDLEVFMRTSASPAQVAAVRTRIASDGDVSTFTFVDHDAALEEFKRMFSDEPELIARTVASSLPESFRIALRDGASVSAARSRFEVMANVAAVITQSKAWTSPLLDTPSSGEAEVFMEVNASVAEIDKVRARLAGDPAVEEYVFLSKEDALAEFRRLFQDEPSLIENTEAAALPTSFMITLNDPGTSTDFERRYRDLAGVQNVNTSGSRLAALCAPE